MNVLFLSQCVIVAVVVHCSVDVTGQFTAAPPTCPGDIFTFKCTVTGNMSGLTIWRVNNTREGESSRCNLVHRTLSSPICGPGNVFTSRSESGFGTNGPSFSSTLSGTADTTLDGTLVDCFGPANNVDTGNKMGCSTLQVVGPPSAPTLSCVGLSENVSGAVNLTVNWTLSDGGSADFYLISITTNAPLTSYGGLLNISGSVTQYELTGFMPDYRYNITVRGVNCGSQKGSESEPLAIRPQAPAVIRSCNITIVYKKSSQRLQYIKSTWNTMPEPVDPMEACQGPRGVITQYQTRFQSGSVVHTGNVNIASCTAWRCSHTFQQASDLPSSYDIVSVAAENVVGFGAARTCTAQPINATNNILTGEMVDVSSPNNVTVSCIFLSEFTGSAHCRVHYGTDPTYTNLPYSAESTDSGTAGGSVHVVLREQLNSVSTYYYTISAVSGAVTVMVHGTFTTPQYGCSLSDLTPTDPVGLCADRGFVNTLPIPNGVVCYNRTTGGSEAVYFCDDEFYQNGAATRVCQNDVWNGSIPQCFSDQNLPTGAKGSLSTGAAVGIAVVTTAVVIFVAGILVGVLATILVYHCISKQHSQNSKPESPSHQQQQAISASNPQQQTSPEYEEVIKLRQNTAYEHIRTDIEMRVNEAYLPMQQ